MKAFLFCLLLGSMCLAPAAPVVSQELSPSPGILPQEVCAALEAYFAKVNAARSIVDEAQRREKYNEAKTELEQLLQKHSSTALLTQASLYASYSEQVVTSDAADPKLPELLDKRLKVRMTLLESCPGYTATR
jgi:hypothetical protein